MKCDKAVLWLSDYIDELLTPENKKQLEEHIHQCNSCASELRQLQKTIDLIKKLPKTPAPKDLREGISRAIEPVPWLRVYRNLSLAAGLLFSFVLGIWFIIYQDRIALTTESAVAKSDVLSSDRDDKKQNEQPVPQQTIIKNSKFETKTKIKTNTNARQGKILRKKLEKIPKKKNNYERAKKQEFKVRNEISDESFGNKFNAIENEKRFQKTKSGKKIEKRVLHDSPLDHIARESFDDDNIAGSFHGEDSSNKGAQDAEAESTRRSFNEEFSSDGEGPEVGDAVDVEAGEAGDTADSFDEDDSSSEGMQVGDVEAEDTADSFDEDDQSFGQTVKSNDTVEEYIDQFLSATQKKKVEPALPKKDKTKEKETEEKKEKSALASGAPYETRGAQFENEVYKKDSMGLNRDILIEPLLNKNKHKTESCNRCHVDNIDLMHKHLAKKISLTNLYQQFINCNDCHTILDKKLIRSGHPIPKNNISSLFSSEDSKIAEQIFVVQKMVQLELSLRGLSTAKREGKFASYMRQTISVVYAQLKANTYLHNKKYVSTVLKKLQSTELRIGNSLQLLNLARYIKQKLPASSFLPVERQLQVQEQHMQPELLEESDENRDENSDQ
ncbi:anti-sigma factor [Candidatus Uabimicrobium sp. HlEnr_7]|uniref:anti-sigma factor family protein n=1 Tax=Candidatus Uabimicrobium helgolandensis TaxID=3095367 RepID=UPI0035581933